MTRVAILGITGEMGSRVARLVSRWVPSARIVGSNRSGQGSPNFAVRALEVGDEAGLMEFARDADILVNCVGPYDHDPVPIVKACIRGRCHYADLSEVPAFIDRVRGAAKAFDARSRGVAVIPGCSTVPGLAQLIATQWRERAGITSVDAFLAMASKSPASASLLTGLLQPMGRPGPEGRWYVRASRAVASDGRRLTGGRYPAAFPEGEIRVGPGRVPFHFSIGFDRGWIGRGLVFVAPIVGWLPPHVIPRLARAIVPMARAVSWLGSPRGILVEVARANGGKEVARIEVEAVAGGLDIPAAPALWVVQRFDKTGSLPVAGAVELDQLVAWEDACDWLRAAGYRVTA